MLDKELIVGLDFGVMDMIRNRNCQSNSRNVSLMIRWTDNGPRDLLTFDRDLPNLVWGLLYMTWRVSYAASPMPIHILCCEEDLNGIFFHIHHWGPFSVIDQQAKN
jgi:hypothetical protein